ncbi:MAG: S8/S53 family peptidase [bacterium]
MSRRSRALTIAAILLALAGLAVAGFGEPSLGDGASRGGGASSFAGASEPEPEPEPEPTPDAGADGCVPAAPAPPPWTPPATSIGGGCFADRFFVEVATGDPDLPAAYEAALQARLDAHKVDLLDWICPDGDLVCRDPSQPTPATVAPVLTAPRAWTIVLSAPARDDKLCEAVEGIRTIAREAKKRVGLGPAHPMPFVGRQCALRAMDAELAATPEMLKWHQDLVYDGLTPEAPGEPVNVLLLDTGVRWQVGDDLGVQTLWTQLDGIQSDASMPLHPHGTWMALFIRQLSPSARIFDLRVLNEHGIGAISDLATALDDAIGEDDFEVGPLVVNLSLGWAPELSRPRVITGPACSGVEDPVGEAVRYALARFGDRDADIDSTVVLAAAGNRPERAARAAELYGAFFAVAEDTGGPRPPHSACPGAPAPPAPDWFYPAEWNRRPTCELQGTTLGAPRYLAWAIGATDDRDEATVLSIDGPEPPVVAPGQHVYADHPFGGDPVPAPLCTGAPSVNLLHLPGAVTGSSVSTALVAGAAAEAQRRRAEHGQAPLAGAALQHLVHLSALEVGRPAWRPDPGGLDPVEVRRLSWCGLFGALEEAGTGGAAACTDLLACVATPRAAVVDGALIAACGDAARDCFAATGCAGVRPRPVSWSPGYSAPVVCVEDEACPDVWVSTAACELPGAGGCPHEQNIEQHQAAPMGPSPGLAGCPECSFVDHPSGPDGTLLGEITESLSFGTVLRYPIILVDYELPLGNPVREYIHLPQSQPWQAGDNVKTVNLPALSAAARSAPKGVQLSLWVLVDPLFGPSTSNVSPLRLITQP